MNINEKLETILSEFISVRLNITLLKDLVSTTLKKDMPLVSETLTIFLSEKEEEFNRNINVLCQYITTDRD